MNGIGPVPWPLGFQYRDIVPGDSHVASLLGMTYFYVFQNIVTAVYSLRWRDGGPVPYDGCSVNKTREGQDPPLQFIICNFEFLIFTRFHSSGGVTPPTRRGRATSPQGEAFLGARIIWTRYGLPPALLRSATPLINAGGERLVRIVTAYHSTGGLPHQCAHWFAMTCVF